MHSQHDDNDHIPVEVVGWCEGITKGRHIITVVVSTGNDNSDCLTGWGSNDYMEVWEPTQQERSMITYFQAVNTGSGVDQGSSVLGMKASVNDVKKNNETASSEGKGGDM